MEHKHILVMCICLLYKESLISKDHNSQILVEETIKNITIPEIRNTAGRTRELMLECKRQIKTMINNGPGHKYNSNILKSKIASIFGSDDATVLEMLTNMIVEEDKEFTKEIKDGIIDEISQLIRELTIFNSKGKITEIIEKFSAQMRFHDTTVDWEHVSEEIISKLEPFRNIGVGIKHKGIMDVVDFSNKDSIFSVLNSAVAIDSGEGLLSLGHQALNDMFGGGLRPGEALLLSAEDGGGKSLLTIILLLSLMAFNKAKIREGKGLLPCAIRFSLENDSVQDIPWMYKFVAENDLGKLVDISDIDVGEASSYLSKRFSQNGWTFINIRLDPTLVTNADIINIITQHMQKGYDVQVAVIDYLSMTLGPGAKSEDYRDNLRKMCNFTRSNGTIFMTPHQAASEAMVNFKRDYPGKVVKQMVGSKAWASSKQLSQDPDITVWSHIERVEVEEGNIASYLTIARDKHRGRTRHTPARFLYCCFPFQPIGTVPWDIGKPKTNIPKPGANVCNGSSDKVEWGD